MISESGNERSIAQEYVYRAARRTTNFSALVRSDSSDLDFYVQVVEFSESGMGMVSPVELKAGTEITAEISLVGGAAPVLLLGRVIHCGSVVGVAFEERSKAHAAELFALLEAPVKDRPKI